MKEHGNGLGWAPLAKVTGLGRQGLAGWAWQAGLGWLVGWAGGLTGCAGQPAI